MNENYHEDFAKEKAYLDRTITFLQNILAEETDDLAYIKQKLITARKDMWENTSHSTRDFTKLTEMNQYLTEVNAQTRFYLNRYRHINQFKKMLDSPYFGRFDFVEAGNENRKNIYIGLVNVMDRQTGEIYVYDWRAPISSIFYRYELGCASYDSLAGNIAGEVLLKRQYRIKNADLQYFFDSSIRITDEILQDILSRNTSSQMRSIVQTIQREQDLIIRDTENDLLLVQGAAGSGKTSVVLHRIAFLLYHELSSIKVDHRNFLIISPHTLLNNYISNVLPELGEKNVHQITFDELITFLFHDRLSLETKAYWLESLLNLPPQESVFKRKCMEFKGSETFVAILNRFLHYYTRHMIVFEDIYYDGLVLVTRQQLRNRFLNNKTGIPVTKQLLRIENMVLEKIHPLQKKRLERIQNIVAQNPDHQLEIKPYSRLLAIKEAKRFKNRLHKFTKIDYFAVYKFLFTQQELFFRLAEGLELPDNIEAIFKATRENLAGEKLLYEDCAPLIYLMLKLEGCDLFPGIRHVVIDEAQDYNPLCYEIFKILFKDAQYTVVGDINQAIDKEADYTIYDNISKILAKERCLKLFLMKNYRSSYEIDAFSKKVLGKQPDQVAFERHEKEPMIIYENSTECLDEAIVKDINLMLKEGYENIAVICKSQKDSQALYYRLKDRLNINLVTIDDHKLEKGVYVIPSYLSKGLEFDVVMVYGIDDEHYSNDLDKKLLYIACTRALHRLILYYTGKKCRFVL